jgi:hypothetical protein
MKLISYAASGLVLAVVLTASVGCGDNIALIGRPTLQLDQEEIFAAVERVDSASRTLHLRLEDGRNRVVGYSSDARVLHHGRDYSIAQLKRGDQVSVQLNTDSRGNNSTNLIRVLEDVQERDQNRDTNAGSVPRAQTLDGRVERMDVQGRSFEIRDQSGAPVVVSLPADAPRSDVERFRALRNGDYVRVEGKFLDRQRFELATFSRDNR